jgi:hypothetical protein
MPAGEVGLMDPAGEMWSVVTESPNTPRTRAPTTLPVRPGFMEKFWKNGGSAM